MQERELIDDISLFTVLPNSKNNLLLENLKYLESGYDYKIWGMDKLSQVIDRIQSFPNIILVMRGVNHLYGFSAIFKTEEGLESIIFIHEEHRGKNIARILNHSIASAAKRMGLPVHAKLKTNNHAGVKAYSKTFPHIEPIVESDHYIWRLTEGNYEHWQYEYRDKNMTEDLYWALLKFKK
jgi:GNAT superfamily N-acetyltransferase